MAELLKGAPVAASLQEHSAQSCQMLQAQGIQPTLAIVRVGERSEDLSYEKGILKRAEAVGVAVQSFVLEPTCTTRDLLDVIERINADASIHGCLIFRPLPTLMDKRRVCAAVAPEKDIDGITPSSLYGVFAQQSIGFAPCTVEAVIRLLDFYQLDLQGKHVVVIGRSLVVGRPLASLLLARHATTTICHTKTTGLEDITASADIVVVAAGKARMFTQAAAGFGQVIVDVGIHFDPAINKLVGDVAFDEVEPVVDAITPVPGGVGSVTSAVLIDHVVRAAKLSAEKPDASAAAAEKPAASAVNHTASEGKLSCH